MAQSPRARLSSNTRVFGLQRISKFFESADTESIQNALLKAARSLPDTTTSKDKIMENTFQVPENRGQLFRNDRKEKETDSDWKGTLNVNGQIIKFIGYDAQTKNGNNYIKILVSKGGGGGGGGKPKQPYPREVRSHIEDSDVPW
jgi:hypothetical protein